MFNKILIILLLLTGLVYADNGWSEPVLISHGNFNMSPNIVVDNTGTLHAFWSRADSIPVSNHGCIMHTFSSDKGLNWSTPVDVSENATDRPITPTAMIDSRNNIHLIYKNIGNSEVWYRRKQDGVWQTPELVYDFADTQLKAVIDKDDNVYVFWLNVGLRQTFYRVRHADGNWGAKKLLNEKILHYNVEYDGDNFIHIAGADGKDYTQPDNKAYYLKYDINQDSVINITDLSNGLRPSQATAIASMKNGSDQIFAGINHYQGIPYESDSYYSTKCHGSWELPEKITQKTFVKSKQIIVDSGANPHIFDGSSNRDTLFLSSKVSNGWTKENVAYDAYGNGYFISNFYNVIIYENIFYLLFCQAKYGDSKVYFKKKRISVGIEDNYELQITNYELTNYPNPFNNTTQISFVLPHNRNVKLEVFNAKGEFVQSVFSGNLESGRHSYSFNAKNLNSGVYYCRLTAGDVSKTTKLILLK